MKSEQIKQITKRAIEQLMPALNEGRSETLTVYLAGIGRFIDLFPTPSLMTQTRLAEAYAEDRGGGPFTYRPSVSTMSSSAF